MSYLLSENFLKVLFESLKENENQMASGIITVSFGIPMSNPHPKIPACSSGADPEIKQ